MLQKSSIVFVNRADYVLMFVVIDARAWERMGLDLRHGSTDI